MTLWHKPAYTPDDRDPTTGALLPGALAPGLYCEDEAAFAKLRAAARLRDSSVRATLDGGWDLAGQRVFIATPEQARVFRAVAMKEPPPPPTEPTAEPLEAMSRGPLMTMDHLRNAAILAKAERRSARQQAAADTATRHPFIGANRAQRRAAEARARRQA